MELIFGSVPRYGYGDGYGYGSGYGDGSGYGYGDGSGYGSGSKTYWAACIDAFTAQWPDAQTKRLVELRDAGATIAYWLSDAKGKPCNGGTGKPVSPGHVDTEKGPLNLCSRGTLHATHLPTRWQGARWWIVALTGEVMSDDDKFGALSREVIGEAKLN